MAGAGRVLVMGGPADEQSAARALLAGAGYEVTTDARSGRALPEIDPAAFTALVVLAEPAAPTVVELRQRAGLRHLPVIAVLATGDTAGGHAATEVRAAGADDVVRRPLATSALAIRVTAAVVARAAAREAASAAAFEDAVDELHRVIARGVALNEALRELLLVACPRVGFERASIVIVSEDGSHGFVVAATDDPTMSKFVVDLATYAEVRTALSRGEPVLLEDVQHSPLVAGQIEWLQRNDINSTVVWPLRWKARVNGVIFLRSSHKGAARLSAHAARLLGILAALVTREVGAGEALAELREQTHRISLARYTSERRTRAIEQLREYFEAASDGVAVVDGDGKVLLVNHAAESITGFAREGLVGAPLSDLVPEAQRDGFQEVIARVLTGTNLEAFDLDLATTSGDPICVSVATSTVLAEHGAAILSFRDVTAERALETELRKTKEFLEKLIDSAVDAIIAADLEGNILIFNPGAERISGYSAVEVIGSMNVAKLYPEGVARQIMHMLRSPSAGGVGRLEVTRREITTKQGDVVPVNLTASIIYEDGREVATVGIFSDLRDRIRIEQRLLAAQEKLQLSEKQAVVAELAGAAAHELNQPLTSVMGYAELLRKKMRPEEPHYRGIDTIWNEANRMAEIVRKIGRITRYETKAYVGGAQILDLDKASARPEPVWPETPDKPPEGKP
jgi:PAS domain S-box-containing protein